MRRRAGPARPPGGWAPEPRRPYPNGWFAVAFSDDVPAGAVRTVRFMGGELVVYRTRGGAIRAVEPFCPHLGAHLGIGGRVEGEELVCPFHRFAFDTRGRCTRTAYGGPPAKARLTQRTCDEVNGAVMVWRDAGGRSPTWSVPDLPSAGFPAPARHLSTIVDHPQEIVENAVDIGHIGPIHGYRDVRVREPMATDGHRMTIGPAAKRVFPGGKELDVLFDVEAHGLGYIAVDASLPQLRATARFLAMATPIDPVRMDLRFSVALRIASRRRRSEPLARFTSRFLTRSLAPAFWRDLSRDFPIWENKAYVASPRLAKGDGPIMPFRRWPSSSTPTNPS
jgi:phenylpropionate dioxygenase-like ring-hydroxylating dioxygenase large terminal subunit